MWLVAAGLQQQDLVQLQGERVGVCGGEELPQPPPLLLRQLLLELQG